MQLFGVADKFIGVKICLYDINTGIESGCLLSIYSQFYKLDNLKPNKRRGNMKSLERLHTITQ